MKLVRLVLCYAIWHIRCLTVSTDLVLSNFVLAKRLRISCFPRLFMCGRLRNLGFAISITIPDRKYPKPTEIMFGLHNNWRRPSKNYDRVQYWKTKVINYDRGYC